MHFQCSSALQNHVIQILADRSNCNAHVGEKVQIDLAVITLGILMENDPWSFFASFVGLDATLHTPYTTNRRIAYSSFTTATSNACNPFLNRFATIHSAERIRRQAQALLFQPNTSPPIQRGSYLNVRMRRRFRCAKRVPKTTQLCGFPLSPLTSISSAIPLPQLTIESSSAGAKSQGE